MFVSVFPKKQTTKALLLLVFLFARSSPGSVLAQEEKKPEVVGLMKQWEKEVRESMQKTPGVKALADKFPLVILHSGTLYCAEGEYMGSAFDFVHETSDQKKQLATLDMATAVVAWVCINSSHYF